MARSTLIACGLSTSLLAFAQTPPKTWVDPDTGHRVIRLTDIPGSRGLYFNVNAFTPDGNWMVYSAHGNLYVTNLTGTASRLVASGPISSAVVARNQPLIYFMRGHDPTISRTNIDTGEITTVGTLPIGARLDSINSDGTLLAGVYVDSSDPYLKGLALPQGVRPSKKAKERARFDAKIPMGLFVFDTRTSTSKTILRGQDWLNHVQFSPTDPTLLMYCHEGPWNEVDRIWTIRADGSQNTLVHHRTLEMKKETAGHEFWDADGKTVWYDLQLPKSQNFYLAGYNTQSGKTYRYQIDRSQWAIHFNGDLASNLFCADGASWFGAASSQDAQWIELLRPVASADGSSTVMESERLVNMAKQDYTDEPNVHFSPDHKWVIFTSNMFGPDYVFATEVAKTYVGTQARHTFTPDPPMSDTDPNVNILVTDRSGNPVAHAIVDILSLDTLKRAGRYVTGADGMTLQFFLDKDLHRFTVTLLDGSTVVSEQIAPPFKNVVHLVVGRTPSPYPMTTSHVQFLVKDSYGTPLSKADVLIRTPDSAFEKWYATGEDGSTTATIPADPATVVVLTNWTTHSYMLSSHCDDLSKTSSVGPCVPIASPSILTINR